MSGLNPAVFSVDGEKYPIKPRVFPVIQSYLYKDEKIKWVDIEEPYVEYGFESKGDVKKIVRSARQILTDSIIGRFVISTLGLEPVQNSKLEN